MSVFTPFRSKTALTTAIVVGSALKLVPTWVAGSQVLHAQVQQTNITQIGGVAVIPAVCDNSTSVLSTIFYAFSTQSQLVVTSGSSFVVNVCGWNFTTADSTVVIKFVQGTSTDCITGAANLSGGYNFSSKSGMVVPNTGAVQFHTSSNNTLCVNATSTGAAGILTYKHST